MQTKIPDLCLIFFNLKFGVKYSHFQIVNGKLVSTQIKQEKTYKERFGDNTRVSSDVLLETEPDFRRPLHWLSKSISAHNVQMPIIQVS